MKLALKLYLCVLVVLFCLSLSHASGANKGTYYTKVNIWYENSQKIASTNYHRGAMIPVGTKVNVLGISGDKITFTTEDQQGVTFVLINMRKHSLVDTQVLFTQHFSETDPKAAGGEFSKFNNKERDNIEAGTVSEGMSREAVIMSYGYPPKHRTPALTNNIWTYWDARATRRVVSFRNERVSRIEEINEYEEGRPRTQWYHYIY